MTTSILNAVFAYFVSRTPTEMARDLWRNEDALIHKAWAERFANGLTYAWGKMDRETRQRFVDFAIEWEKQDKTRESLTLGIALGNAAFRHDDGTLDFGQVSELLHDLSVKVKNGQTNIAAKDDNGNTVGRLLIVPD